MQIFFTTNSPYARITRLAAHACGVPFEPVEVASNRLRTDDNPVLVHNRTGRVPTLVDGNVVLGETRTICRYIEAQMAPGGDDTRLFAYQGDWAAERFECTAISLLDGAALWTREYRRPTEQQSDWLCGVERARAARTLDWFDTQPGVRAGGTPWDFAHITLAVAVEYLELRDLIPDWRQGRDALAGWMAVQQARPSMRAHPFVTGA